MPAKVTIYNDSDTARDLMVTLIPAHSKAPIRNQVIPASEEHREPYMPELEMGDIIIIRRVE